MTETRVESTSRKMPDETRQDPHSPDPLLEKLWLYTNFDCNMACSYCVSESTPTAPRRPLGLQRVRKLVDEACVLGFRKLLFTGGEPFLLEEIYDMLEYASARLDTIVLTNAVLFSKKRLDRLARITNNNLTVQVSLDGGRPQDNDAYRGEGSWERTVEGIRKLMSRGIRTTLSTTVTPLNEGHMDSLHAFVQDLGIPIEDHLVRPLARRGFSSEGMEVTRESLLPEITVTAVGIFWHPLISPSDSDMMIREEIFPLSESVSLVRQHLDHQGEACQTSRTGFQ
jgi:MoaA/NifB/PqqE/SkfB family radical SAM enzyme